MASGKDHFLYEDDLDAIFAIMDADMFENNKDMESEIVMCIKKTILLRKLFVQMLVLSENLSMQSRFIKAQESKTSNAYYTW